MRISARHVALATAVVGLWIGSITVAQASMAAAMPPPTDPTAGTCRRHRSTFFVGDTITITANFADSQSGKVITFYKETSPGSGQYDSIGTKTANCLRQRLAHRLHDQRDSRRSSPAPVPARRPRSTR